MLTVGDTFPGFDLQAAVSNKSSSGLVRITDQDYADQWKVIFFWPKDFTFICPTEIAEFASLNSDFSNANATVFGVSVDTKFMRRTWRLQHPQLQHLPFPMLTDIKRELSQALGIIDKIEGVAQRATFVVDPENTIRYASVTDVSVGRNAREILRVLKALQTGDLCPASWQKGTNNLEVA